MIHLTAQTDFGSVLRRMQADAGMNTTQLSEVVACTRAHLSNLRWAKARPGYDLLIQLADILDHDVVLIPRTPATEGDHA